MLAKKFNSKEGEVDESLELSDLEKLEEAEVESMLLETPEAFHSKGLLEEFTQLEVLEKSMSILDLKVSWRLVRVKVY